MALHKPPLLHKIRWGCTKFWILDFGKVLNISMIFLFWRKPTVVCDLLLKLPNT